MDTSDYKGYRHLNQVNLTGGEDNYSSLEVKFGDIEYWQPDIEVEHYMVNRRVVGEYRDAEQTEVRDAFGTFAEANLPRQWRGEKTRTIKKLESHLWKHMGTYESFRNRRLRKSNRKNVSGICNRN